MAERYTDQKLIEMLQSFAGGLSDTPTKRQVSLSDEMPSAKTYQDRFGSWNKALDCAGLSSRAKYGQRDMSGEKYFNRLKDSIECQRCGEGRNPLIDFHHIHDKSFGINRGGRTGEPDNIYQEAQKCVPLCANCHRLHHYGDAEFDANEIDIPEYPRPQE